MAPPAAMTGSSEGNGFGASALPGSNLKKPAIPLRSASFMCENDRETASAIGPVAAVTRLCQLLRKATTSSAVQAPSPARLSLVVLGANHPCRYETSRYWLIVSPPNKDFGV